MNFSRRLLYLAVCIGPVVPAALAQPARIAGRIDNTQTVVLSGHVRPEANPQNDRGAVEGGFQLPDVLLFVKPSAAQQSDLEQFVQQQQDPSSADYHRWLTPEQFADRFGVNTADMAQITAWLGSQGFTVNNVARSRTFVSFSGTAAQIQGALHTSIRRYSVNGVAHFANATAPAIPAALADVVAGFHGLSDFHPKARLKKANPQMTSSGGSHHIVPDDFATIFDIMPLYAAGVDGTGQSIVIVGQSAIHTSDYTSFFSQFNLTPPNLQQKLVSGRSPGVVEGDEEESDLDLEWAGAVARNATIIFAYSDDVWTSAMQAVAEDLGPIISMSYGSCEQSDMVDLPTFRNTVLQANSQGITWFAASGDSGAADCEDQDAVIAQDGLAIDVPGAIPEVTSMGGTTLNEGADPGQYWSATNTANMASALGYIPATAWNDTADGFGLAATGGGASIYFARPVWQTGPGVPNDSARHVPDMAFPASADHDSLYFYSAGSPGYVGGTSAATPTMAGVFALLNQYLVSTKVQTQAGLGNINPTLYRLAGTTTGVFHDITQGNNIVPCVAGSPNCQNGSLGYSAGSGYDQTTGLGSVDVANLVHQWSSQPATSSAVAPSIDQNPVFENGSQWAFKLTLTEEAGIGSTLTGFTINGTSYSSQINALFGTASIKPHGSIAASYSLTGLTVPTTVVFGFTGVDAGGAAWSTQLSIPFQGPQIQLTVGGVSNAATGQQVYAPGMIMSVYGTGLGDFVQSAGTIPLPQYLAGFEAYVNNYNAPLYYVSPNQVNLQIPYEAQPGPATLTVGNPYVNVNYNFVVSATAPGIFTFADGSVNPSRTGSSGQQVILYITGEGQVRPSLEDGASPSPSTPLAELPKPRQSYSLTVGGQTAVINFIGIPSGLVGVTQINFTIPAGLSGPQPVVVTVGGIASPPATITITQ
jgi:uncharacterized protein (TIGR03437 family)